LSNASNPFSEGEQVVISADSPKETRMKTSTPWIGTLAAILTSPVWGQDIAGSWQGTLKAGATDLRTIFEIARGDSGSWKAVMFSIDQTTESIPVSAVTLEDSTLKLTVADIRGAFEGKISADGSSITGCAPQKFNSTGNPL
jgi:hypothetical protein